MKQNFLGREEVYTASPRIWSFQKVEENVNGIMLRVTNMAGGYHFYCNGIEWADSERLKAENAHLKKKALEHLINVETNKINDIGEWRGQNNIGKILMICRDCLREGVEPEIDYELLRQHNIYLFGKLLTLPTIPDDHPTKQATDTDEVFPNNQIQLLDGRLIDCLPLEQPKGNKVKKFIANNHEQDNSKTDDRL